MKAGIAVALCTLCVPMVMSAQKNDTIRLFNGDRVVAEMKDLKLGLLRLSTDYMNTVYVQWDQIQTLRTTKRWYVRLRSGAYYDGYLAPSAQLDHLYIVTDRDSIHVNLIDITTLYRLNKGIWPRMDGSLSAGYSYQKLQRAEPADPRRQHDLPRGQGQPWTFRSIPSPPPSPRWTTTESRISPWVASATSGADGPRA